MTSRSDRPYGQFPRGDASEPAPAPQSPRRVPLRERVVARLRTPATLLALLALSWFLVSSVESGARLALRAEVEQPTPSPTPQLAALIYQHVAPSVVQVSARGSTGEPNNGAGVIVDDMADILTSLHIIDGGGELQVRFNDGTTSKVEVVARLPDRDIAVLRALTPPADFQPATLGNPGSLSIGDPAFVIGHPFGLTGSLSTGVISGLDRAMSAPGLARPITGLIQFDAAVNPGSSGGPLVDQRGDVVGIVTGLVNPGGKVFSGVGFAVTIDSASAGLGIPPD
ncbi:MAG TPA: trypsin-like peptidase domain-containing protein [Candidatus Limnocylindria bacterium]|jgi:S1-C subfamily serine protease|nr:trypsin-like peptidase domain-containing protein [Candidatus Limnocylindria bacterium]